MNQLELPIDHEPCIKYWVAKNTEFDLADGYHQDQEKAHHENNYQVRELIAEYLYGYGAEI